MKNTKTLLALTLLASAVAIGGGRAAPLPTNIAAMKGVVDNSAVEVRWGGWGGGWRGGWGYRGWRGGYGGWGYRGWGAAAAGAIVGGAIASAAYGGYPYYGAGYGYGYGSGYGYCPPGAGYGYYAQPRYYGW
ncbi:MULTISPECIES: hypothetical protein [unclassified Bradyrhizobium]|uniref:hypothetical protein n=1 Tax=unclassified Bradyrhizobium TaxID=2631580 RepID=UPI001BA7FDEB|nr:MULTISPECIES: hypothetical protein [unclassified Bradyrhizobium]MBR1202986.1 hypothetical protein [Bradyrhizobium sp. AUGA SZCCT0124]MBR1314400.1 hypothetical protein [Bradyrhizobium sp. AUGA SZCCT0051]MBR1342582.1 hypothetical protein [Bradyrhizobium sp. AUGA SZCCT0105]MBR1352811.1 hypothetical protein [Bradyrhizobium sp. AUGA SZCCT0045]